MVPITSDAVIGANMKLLRNRQGWTQARLAEYLRFFTIAPWDQQQVSRAEHGKRPFRVVDLFVLSYIFRVSALRLIHTGRGDADIIFGRIGVAETRLLHKWILQPRLTGAFDKDQLVAGWPDPFDDTLLDLSMENLQEAIGEENGDD